MKIRAFTLAETLLMMAIVGILGLITLGSFTKLKPDKEAMLFRKAYESTIKIVSALINDEDLYPTVSAYNVSETLLSYNAAVSSYPSANFVTYSVSSGGDDDRTLSLSNTVSEDSSSTSTSTTIRNRSEAFKDTTVYNGATAYTKNNKFAYNFAAKMTKKGSLTVSTSSVTFTTPDGIYWEVDDYFNSSDYATVSIYPVGNVTGAVAIPIKVEASGAVSATTALGQDYLKTRK